MPIKQMFQYEDIDGVNTTRTVMFNLTQFEVEGEMELEVIQARFQKFQDEVIGNDPNAPLREMTGPEKREILGMVKTLIKHAYGIREGKRFVKSQEVWDEFEQTGAFSAFLYWLFSDPNRVNSFMNGIWPQGLDRPDEEVGPNLRSVPDQPVATDEPEYVKGEFIETPSIESAAIGPVAGEWYETKDSLFDYTKEELLTMSDGEFEAVTAKFTEGRNVPLPLIQIAGQRRSQAGGQTE